MAMLVAIDMPRPVDGRRETAVVQAFGAFVCGAREQA